MPRLVTEAVHPYEIKRRGAMVEILPESEGNVLGIRVSGKLTLEDYKEILIPEVNKILKNHDKLRILTLVDETFRGRELRAIPENLKFGIKNRKRIEKSAVVADSKLIRTLAKVGSYFMRGPVKTFPEKKLDAAWTWIKA
jgi:hypothetical protein